jgi:hypothetical protein
MIEFEGAVVGLARRDDPDTSKEAAALVDATGLMREIYFAMLPFGWRGCNSDEVSDALPHLENQTFTPRFKQMIDRGYIEKTGEKRIGHHNNRKQDVRRVLHPPFSPPLSLVQQKCCPHCGGPL